MHQPRLGSKVNCWMLDGCVMIIFTFPLSEMHCSGVSSGIDFSQRGGSSALSPALGVPFSLCQIPAGAVGIKLKPVSLSAGALGAVDTSREMHTMLEEASSDFCIPAPKLLIFASLMGSTSPSEAQKASPSWNLRRLEVKSHEAPRRYLKASTQMQ